MQQIMFKVPDMPEVSEVIVTKDAVLHMSEADQYVKYIKK
jgi:ATP-dependent protease Clp ATPase subunit